jgi:hypothetical protein
MVTAFLGPRGTFSEDAAVAFAGPNGELLPVGSIPGAVAALANPFLVDQLTLYRSHLSHQGASYEPLARSRLA